MSGSNKVVLITGAARRIGAAIAQELHVADYNIVIHYHRSQADALHLADSLNQRRANSAITFPQDLLDISALANLVDKAANHWGHLDALVNNASGFFVTPVGKISEKEWDELFASNAKAPFFLSQAAVPWLQKNQGNIVNIIDIHAQHTYLKHSIYCAAKAALYSLTTNLARELAPEIRVNGVSPGPSVWPEGANALSEDKKKNILERQPLRQLATPADIAKTVYFLLQNGSITGQIVAVDAGRSLV